MTLLIRLDRLPLSPMAPLDTLHSACASMACTSCCAGAAGAADEAATAYVGECSAQHRRGLGSDSDSGRQSALHRHNEYLDGNYELMVSR